MEKSKLKIENCKILNERDVNCGFTEKPTEYLAIEKRLPSLLFDDELSTEFHLFLWDYAHHRYQSVQTICISADLMFDTYDEIHDRIVELYKKKVKHTFRAYGMEYHN